MCVNDAYTKDEAISAMHPCDLHIDIQRRSRINQTVGSCENSLPVDIPQHVLLCEQCQERSPVLLVDARHRIAPCRFKEISAMPHNRQFFIANLRGVFNIIIRVHINHEDVIVVSRERLGDLCVGRALLVRRGDGEHGKRNRHAACDRVYADPARKSMNHRTVRHLFIEERAVFSVAALPDHCGKVSPVFGSGFSEALLGLQYVDVKKASDKILVGAVAADIPGFAISDLQNRDR